MYRKNTFSKDLITVIFSNLIILLSSVVTGFIVPKLLGVEGYGYYKIFTLYLSYSALAHMGYVDGVLLQFAGKEYEELSKEKFRRYTAFFFEFQCIIAFFIIIIALFILRGEYRIIFFMLAIDIVAVNMTAYYQYISQSTMRFLELSIRKVLFAILKISFVLLMLVCYTIGLTEAVNVNVYIAGLVLIDIILLVWYAITYKEFSAGKKATYLQCKNDIRNFFKEGIVLTIAYQTTSIIFSLDSQFVSVLYDTYTYGIYSFAYSLISMVTTVIGAVSFVLFPRLKKLDSEVIINTFPNAMALITIIAVISMVGYYPLSILIISKLSEYIQALDYLRIIIPGLSLSCCINIIMFTYYQALNKHQVYFKISLFILVLAIALNYGFYKIFQDPVAISIASIITLLIWYIASEYYFIKNYKTKRIKNFVYMILSMLVFYFVTGYLESQIIGCFFLIVYLLISTITLYGSLIKKIVLRKY